MSRGGARRWKRFVEAPDVSVAVAARSPDEAYARKPLAPRETQYKIVEPRIARLHRESTTAHRNDMPLRHPLLSLTDIQRAVGLELGVGRPHNFPWVAVGVGEVSRHSSPLSSRRLLENCRTGSLRCVEPRLYGFGPFDVDR